MPKGNFSSWWVGFTINSAMQNSHTAKRSFSWLKPKNDNFKQVRTMQLCYLTAQLEGITRPLLVKLSMIFRVLTWENWNAETFRSFPQKKLYLKWMSNSVLDFALCAKIKRLKLLQQLKDQRLIYGIHFILGFRAVLWTKRQKYLQVFWHI